MPIPAAQNKTEISLILLSEHDNGEITSVEEYIPSVDFLIKKLVKFVQSSICSLTKGSSFTQLSLAKNLAKIFTTNKHCMIICSLLIDFHEYSETIKLKTSPPFYIIPCHGYTNLSEQQTGQNNCSRFILSQYKLAKDAMCKSCFNIKIASQKRLKRKLLNEHNWVNPNSKCNWRYLS